MVLIGLTVSEVGVVVTERADQGVLRWFRHVERMSEETLTRRIYVSEGGGDRGGVRRMN